jgi:MFS family permease
MEKHERQLTWMTGFSHFITHGYMSLLPAVLVVITGELGMSFTTIGIIANIGYFLYGLGAFPAGFLADRIGSKRLLTLGIGGMAVSSILVGLSHGVIAFAVTYALLGLFASIHHPAGLSLIARRVESGKGNALGIHGVMGNVGLFLTPLVAGLGLMVFGTWRAAYIFYGVVGLAFAVILHRTEIHQEESLDWRELCRWPALLRGHGPAVAAAPAKMAANTSTIIPIALLLLFAGSILSGFIFRGSLTFFPALLQSEVDFITSSDEPEVLAGTVTTLVLLLGLVGAWFGGWINDKIKRPELFPIIVFLIVAPTLYLISRCTDSKLLLASCFFSLVYYAWQPSHNFMISRYTHKASQGLGYGINFFLIFGIGSLATAIGGYVADRFSVDRFYLVMSGVGVAALVAAVGVWLLRRWILRFNWVLVREG